MCNSIKPFDFSTHYITIPHSKLKDRLRELIQLCFIKKNVQRRYKYLVLGRDRPYVVNRTILILPKCSLKLISYFFSLVDVFLNRQSAYLWLQTVLLFSSICYFMRVRQTSYRVFLTKNEKMLARSFIFIFHYIDDVLSLNKSTFYDFVDRIYLI